MKTYALVTVALLLLSCADHRSKMKVGVGSGSTTLTAYHKENESVPDVTVPSDRMLVKTGNLRFQCNDIQQTRSQIASICKALQAYVSNEGFTGDDKSTQYHQTIRVPSTHFDTLVTQLETLAVKIEEKDLATEDVTEEYIDVSGRLAASKALVERYIEILKQARTVEDMLAVERELTKVRAEVESMQGRINFLDNQASFSTLSISFHQGGPSSQFYSQFTSAWSTGWHNFLTFIIGLMMIWPFLLVLGGGIIWFLLDRRRRLRNTVTN